MLYGALGAHGAGANRYNRATDMESKKTDQAVSGRPIAKRILTKMKLQWQRKVVEQLTAMKERGPFVGCFLRRFQEAMNAWSSRLQTP